MVNQSDKLFGESLDRCLANAEFIACFYTRFLAVSPEAGVLFERVNMSRQSEMLAASLRMISQAGAGPGTADEHLDELGQFHTRLGVTARMYDQWLDSLIQAVAICDSSFSPEVAAAWREVLGQGIERMKGMRSSRRRAPVAEAPTAATITGPTANLPE